MNLKGSFYMSRDNIARVLKKLRLQSGLTADQVGTKLGKSGKTVNAWENNRGQPDADTLIKLCDIYGVADILAEFKESTTTGPIVLSEHEKQLITAYRLRTNMQAAIDTLLGINKDAAELIADDIIKTTKGQQNTAPINQRTK